MKQLTRKTVRSRRLPSAPAGGTEQQILDAAHAVFVRRGTSGARMQDIAAEAGVNQALLHYYFRSKERLSEAVFRRAAAQLLPRVIEAMASDLSIEDKVARVVELELDHLLRVPYLPGYIISELHHHPERVRQLISAVTGMTPEDVRPRVVTRLREQLDAGVRDGQFRPIAPDQFIVNLFSVHLSVRRAPDAHGPARFGSAGLRALHRAAAGSTRRFRAGGDAPVNMKKTTAAAIIMVCALDARNARAQQAQAAPSRGLQLAALQQAAVDADPRFAQLKLQQAQTDLRVGNIDAERKPSIGVEGQVQWQSDVPTPPPFLPGGTPLFLPPKDTYDAHLRIEQRIFDPTVSTRADLERAQLAESQSRVRVALFGLRQEVNNAFFTAALLQDACRRAGCGGRQPRNPPARNHGTSEQRHRARRRRGDGRGGAPAAPAGRSRTPREPGCGSGAVVSV